MSWSVYENPVDEDFSEYHVIPDFGKPHLRSIDCWCKPHREPSAPYVIVHETEN